jgi:hypothetical protein
MRGSEQLILLVVTSSRLKLLLSQNYFSASHLLTPIANQMGVFQQNR